MAEQQTFTLPAGTVCHRNGIPFKLQHATQIECHPGVWPLIKGEPPEVLEVDVVNPVHPLAPAGAVELVPLLKRLIELLEVAVGPATVTYSFAVDSTEAIDLASPQLERLLECGGAMSVSEIR